MQKKHSWFDDDPPALGAEHVAPQSETERRKKDEKGTSHVKEKPERSNSRRRLLCAENLEPAKYKSRGYEPSRQSHIGLEATHLKQP